MFFLLLTRSTIKSIDSAILLSTLSDVKFPISILLSTSEGRIQKSADESLYSNTDVSVNVLHRIKEATRGQFFVNSANFCAMKPPKKLKNDLLFDFSNNKLLAVIILMTVESLSTHFFGQA